MNSLSTSSEHNAARCDRSQSVSLPAYAALLFALCSLPLAGQAGSSSAVATPPSKAQRLSWRPIDSPASAEKANFSCLAAFLWRLGHYLKVTPYLPQWTQSG